MPFLGVNVNLEDILVEIDAEIASNPRTAAFDENPNETWSRPAQTRRGRNRGAHTAQATTDERRRASTHNCCPKGSLGKRQESRRQRIVASRTRCPWRMPLSSERGCNTTIRRATCRSSQ